MKISMKWLGEMIAHGMSTQDVADRLTLAGLEVEGITRFGDFSGVIVAEVKAKRPHPDAKKLTLVDVFDGTSITQVVCGAPNVPEPGGLVLWARPGARIKGGITLEPKDVRGVISPGMLCAEDELALGEGHAGILVLSDKDGVKPGDDFGEKFGLPDEILELNVTPNRPDCLGHLGVARELAALIGHKLTYRPLIPVASDAPPAAKVELVDAEGCPRYAAFVLEGVRVGPSPLVLRLRLASLGVRAISNVVDATNLAMLATGQPLHAFDLDKLDEGRVVVRPARAGEKMKTLDGEERTLLETDLVISDGKHPVALAGVMGGADSEVSDGTTRILLECAYFDPKTVRRTAKRLGLHTEASHRFERGTDPNRVARVAYECAANIEELCGARITGAITDVYPSVIEPRKLPLRAQRTERVLGIQMSLEEQRRILVGLGLEVEGMGDDMLLVVVPTYRPDLMREIDLIEEIARVHGFENIPPTVPALTTLPGPLAASEPMRIAESLAALGLDETVTYGFVSPHAISAFGFDDWRAKPVRLVNPIREEQSAMRTTLLAGLLTALERNQKRGNRDVRMFEVGTVFEPLSTELVPAHPLRVAAVVAGHSDGWLKDGAEIDFFDLRRVVEELCARLGSRPSFVAAQAAKWLHPGVQAEVRIGDRVVGFVGEVHPDVCARFQIETRAFAFELDALTLAAQNAPKFAELPRFPSSSRDVSFFVDAKVPAGRIEDHIARLREPLLSSFRVLEDYREAGRVPVGKKSMLWSFTYRADRTLTDAEVDETHRRLLDRLVGELALELR